MMAARHLIEGGNNLVQETRELAERSMRERLMLSRITGRHGNDMTDRWLKSPMVMCDLIETLYAKIESEEARANLPSDADRSACTNQPRLKPGGDARSRPTQHPAAFAA